MKWLWLVAAAADPTAAAVAGLAANPIRKVVTLLQQMQEEIEKEGKQEEEMHKKFECYCKKNTENMGEEAKAAAAKIEQLRAQVKEEKAQKAEAEQALKEAKSDRTAAKQALAKATAIREKEKKAYDEAVADEKDDIEATKAAISALEKGMGATAFLQAGFSNRLKHVMQTFNSDNIDTSDRESVMAFLEQSGDYIPASGQIVGILKNMLDEMDKDLGGVIQAEEAALASFLELKSSKEKEIAALSEQIESKTALVGKLAVDIVTHTNEQDDAVEFLEEAQKLAAQLTVTCKEKDGEWEERQKIRGEELSAISETIAFLNNDDSLDSFKASSLGDKKKSFLQKSSSKNNALQKARNVLMQIGQHAQGNALVLLAQSAAAKVKSMEKGAQMKGFEKVMKMCDNMIDLLKKEQKEDDTQLSWCTSSMNTAESEEKDKEHALQTLETTVAGLKSDIEGFKTELEAAAAHNKELDTAVAEATEQRKEEHEEYLEKIKLNTAAVELISKAKNRLNKFYNPGLYEAPKEREMTREEKLAVAAGGDKPDLTVSFVQIKSHDNATEKKPELEAAPEIFEGKYEKKGQKTNAVMAMMDMLTKDLETDTQEAEHAEKTGQANYEKLMADSSKEKAANMKAITEYESAKADAEEELASANDNVTITKDQLVSAGEYIQELHQKCDFLVKNHTMREEMRSREMDSLQNAKAVLSGADYE